MPNLIAEALSGRMPQATQAHRLSLKLDQIKQAAQLANAMRNPNAALASFAQQNPLVQQAQQIAAQYGGDYDKAFLSLCQQNGIDPTDLAQQIKAIL